MDIPKDAAMLLSFMNMKLRDEGCDLDTLCADLGVDRSDIEEKLRTIDYEYDATTNQFT